ncbi:RNase A-like domain-containing protein [Nocardioides sp. CN2-186]|uniref:RNase A-like domain-containing protein n=1 Tax=Nocardioides tweenelious TaxID=3156607 RepID=UPI0032B5944E
MRVLVDEQGYAGAVDAFVGANLLVARAGERLRGSLASYAGMAGDDSTATEFAASYDEAAASCVGAVADLVGALGALAHLTQASLANHRTADARSGGYSVSGPPTRADHCVGLALTSPPSSLGAASPGPPGAAGWMLDHLADIVWPNADTDRVRVAATTWRTAATSVQLVTAHCTTAVAALDTEVSPEIPLAIAVAQDLSSRVDDLADQLVALAVACETYADQVDAKRDDMLGLLRDLAVEFGAGAALGIGLSFLSAGLAGPAAGAAGSARLAAAARELKGIVDALRLATGATALEMRPITVSATEIGLRAQRVNGARVMLMEGEGAASGSGRAISRLAASEGSGRGHTLERHAEKSIDYLRARAARHRTAQHASSFTTRSEAGRLVDNTIQRNASEINAWLRDRTSQLRIDDVLDEVTGISVSRTGEVAHVHGLRVILVRDSGMPDGYWIKTAFPQP